MRKLAAVLGSLAIVVAMSACSSATETASSEAPNPTTLPSASSAPSTAKPADAMFTAMWGALQPTDTPAMAKDLSDTICQGFATGIPMDVQKQSIMLARSVDLPMATLMINTAVNYKCPEHTAAMVSAK